MQTPCHSIFFCSYFSTSLSNAAHDQTSLFPVHPPHLFPVLVVLPCCQRFVCVVVVVLEEAATANKSGSSSSRKGKEEEEEEEEVDES